MQGHFEGSQPSPYANISVNNPSRFTNSNLVNRRYCPDQVQTSQNQSMPIAIKPVIPRRRTVNNAATTSGIHMVPSTQIISTSSAVVLTQDVTPNDVMSIKSPSPSAHMAQQQTAVDIKPNIQNINLQQYNGINIVPNMEIATLFFNQNFNSQPNQQSN